MLIKMEEIPKIKVVYGGDEFEMTEQELDRITAMTSKRLRDDLVSARLGFMPVKKNELRNEKDVKVIKDGYESQLYKAMAETLVYAIETGYLDSYAVPQIKEIQQQIAESPRIDRNAVNTLAKIRNETSHELINREFQKMIFASWKDGIFY